MNARTNTLFSILISMLICGCFLPVDVGSNPNAIVPCTVGVALSCNGAGVGDAGVGAVAGQCVQGTSGAECQCNAGFERDSSGRCTPRDPCANYSCNPGHHCVAPNDVPSCVPDVTRNPCLNFTCNPGYHCVAPNDVPSCVPDATRNPCLNFTCNPGFHCVAPNDVPSCVADPVCTVGVAMSCNDGAIDAGIGAAYGQCVQATTGPQCFCNPGFQLNPLSGRCRPLNCGPSTCGACGAGCVARNQCTTSGWNCQCDCADPGGCTLGVDATCNAIISMSALAGRCVSSGGTTECSCNPGFLRDSSGRCAPALCLETQGSSCRYVLENGTPAPNGTCGSMSVSPGCSCLKNSQGYSVQCLGACMPNDGGVTRACFASNCGPISCVGGQTTCVALGSCQ